MGNDDAYTNLADAIVMTAIEDWRKICKQIIKPRKTGINGVENFGSLRRWLKSGWCDTLSSVDPSAILDKLERELAEARAKQDKQKRLGA